MVGKRTCNEVAHQGEKSPNMMNEVSKANALQSLKQDLDIEEVGEAIDDVFGQDRLQERLNKMARLSNARP